MNTLWNTIEDTGTVTKQEFWTNMTISTTLVNFDFLGIELETVKEE
jgi:hypothetical protein